MRTVIEGDREIVAINTFRLADGVAVPDVRVSEVDEMGGSTLTSQDVDALDRMGT